MSEPDARSEPAGHEPAVDRVHEAQRRLGELDGLPVTSHVETYDEVHAVLQDALAELDEA